MQANTTSPKQHTPPTPSHIICRLLALTALVVGAYLLLTLLLILIQGGEWDHIITVNNPKRRMAGAWLALATGYLLRTATRHPTPRDWASALARLGLVSGSLLLSFLGGELALRHMLRSQQANACIEQLAQMESHRKINFSSFHPLAAIVRMSSNRGMVYELMPGLDMTFGGKTLKTNQRGMRSSREYEIPKPPDTLRMVGIGDSGMFGWGVHQDEDYMTVLERNLQQRPGPMRYEALNFGVPGYNTYQELELLRDRGLDYDPDIVLLGWCDNDFDLPFFLISQADFSRTDLSFLYHLMFNREFFHSLIRPQAERTRSIDHAYIEQALFDYAGYEGVKRAMGELLELSREHPFHLIVFGPMNKHIVEICESLEIPYANTHALIPRDKYPPEYHVHFMHPRAGGHAALAREIETLLDRKGWLTPPPDHSSLVAPE